MSAAADRLNWLIRHRVCTRDVFAEDEACCPACGHAVAVHVGVPCCAVCELRGELADLRAERRSRHGGERAGLRS